jgi:hypothetical protein
LKRFNVKLSFRFRAALVLFFIFAIPAPVLAEMPAETRWADPSSVQLNIEFPGDGYHASWELFRCDCGDLLVRAELNVPGEAVSGDLILVKDRAVLSRGFGKYRAEAASSLDAAALMMQLALRLLERSEPGGPSQITGPLKVDLEDKVNPIVLDTGTAEGGFQAPWSIDGKITPAGESLRRFDLRFTFTAGAPGEVQQASMRLFGLAEFAGTEFPLAGSTALEDWDLSWRDGSVPVPAKPGTLDDLRALLATN